MPGVQLCRTAVAGALALACAARPSAAEITTIPFDLVAGYYVVVRVAINETTTTHLVVDTGSSVTVLDQGLAQKLRLASTAECRAVTHTRAQPAATAPIASLRLDHLYHGPMSVVLADLGMLAAIDHRIEGLLGQDVLSHWSYLIDYHARVLRVDPSGTLASSIEGVAVPLVWSGKRILVPLEVDSDGGRIRMQVALDSAAQTLMVFDTGSDDSVLAKLARVTGIVRVLSIMGGKRGLKGKLNQVAVGSQLLNDVGVTLAERPPGWGARGDGLLPTTLFAAVYVDAQNSRVVVVPRVRRSTLATTP